MIPFEEWLIENRDEVMGVNIKGRSYRLKEHAFSKQPLPKDNMECA